MFGIVDGRDAILDRDALASKGDDSLDDIFLMAESAVVVRIFEYDHLTALGDVGFVLDTGDSDR